ncbi:MAG: DUF2807 domain-containing protein [Lentimicrobiaceae bacterium]|jgi:hypothetical protein
MKTLKLTLTGMMLLTLIFTSVKAQTKGTGSITTQEREVPAFDAIKVGCAINLYISQGDKQMVKVVTDENLQDRIITKVANGTLSLSCDNIKDATKMNVYVTAVNLSKIDASGASKVTGETLLKSDAFGLYTSGAAKTTLNIETGTFNNETSGAASNTISLAAKTANTEVSGAGFLALKGSAEMHKTQVSGAGSLKALEFITDNTDANVSGAGNAKIMARKQLKADLSGAGNITYFDKDNIKKIGKSGQYQITFDGMDNIKSVIIEDENEDADPNETAKESWKLSDDNDSVTVIVNDKRVVVVTDDTVRVNLGQRDYVISDNGVKISKHDKEPKFKGHWAGFELGVNGLLNKDMVIGSPEGYNFMDLNYAKSIAVNINFFEQNINLIRQHLGLVTGMGISWNNYRFDKNVVLTHDGEFNGYFDTDATKSYEKSKLVVTYLRVPLMLEYQTNSKMKANSFHLSGGVVGALRIGSHSKIIVDDNKSKDRSDFYINPFKVDAIAKIGWGVINLYGTYSLTEMFRSNKGPEVYPFEIGITLASF